MTETVVQLQAAIYEKMENGLLRPSAHKMFQGFLRIENDSAEEAIKSFKEWSTKNNIVITKEL